MPLSEKGKKIKKEMIKLISQLEWYSAVSCKKMFYIVAIRAKALKVYSTGIFAVSVFMVAFQYGWVFTKATAFAFLHPMSWKSLASPYLLDVICPSRTRATGSTAISRFMMAFGNKCYATELAFNFRPWLSQPLPTALTATAILLRTAGNSVEFFTTNLTHLSNSCKYFTPTPSNAFSSSLSKIKFVSSFSILHSYSIPQGEGGYQCL